MPLFEKTKKYGEKIENSKSLLKKFSSENLNELFCSQKTSYDKSGLGYIGEGSSIPSITQSPSGTKGRMSLQTLFIIQFILS